VQGKGVEMEKTIKIDKKFYFASLEVKHSYYHMEEGLYLRLGEGIRLYLIKPSREFNQSHEYELKEYYGENRGNGRPYISTLVFSQMGLATLDALLKEREELKIIDGKILTKSEEIMYEARVSRIE